MKTLRWVLMIPAAFGAAFGLLDLLRYMGVDEIYSKQHVLRSLLGLVLPFTLRIVPYFVFVALPSFIAPAGTLVVALSFGFLAVMGLIFSMENSSMHWPIFDALSIMQALLGIGGAVAFTVWLDRRRTHPNA